MNKYETITNINNYRNNYNYNEEITKNLNNLETNIYKRYNNPSMSYFEIKNIIRNEFAELIIPYQNQINSYDNKFNLKFDEMKSNLKGIIDSKIFDNMNQTIQIINLALKNSNYVNNNDKNNIQNRIENNKNNLEYKLNLMLKNQYDNKFDVLERQMNSMNSLLKTFQKTFDSNMLDIIKNNEYKKNYLEQSEYEKYKREIDLEIKKLKEDQKEIKAINEQIENLFKKFNEFTIENNETKSISTNEINLLKNQYNNIDKNILELQNKINFKQLEKLKELNVDNLKNINIYEINEMKEKIKNMDNNIDDLYEKLKSNDKNIDNIIQKYNYLEQNYNYINKDIEFINKQNLNDKIEELNKKLDVSYQE